MDASAVEDYVLVYTWLCLAFLRIWFHWERVPLPLAVNFIPYIVVAHIEFTMYSFHWPCCVRAYLWYYCCILQYLRVVLLCVLFFAVFSLFHSLTLLLSWTRRVRWTKTFGDYLLLSYVDSKLTHFHGLDIGYKIYSLKFCYNRTAFYLHILFLFHTNAFIMLNSLCVCACVWNCIHLTFIGSDTTKCRICSNWLSNGLNEANLLIRLPVSSFKSNWI